MLAAASARISVNGASPGARTADPALRSLGHAKVIQIQRARIISAMYDLVAAHGAAGVSVADVVARSGVSRRTFYEVFSDREDCLLAAFDDALALVCARVLSAYRAERRWREQIRAGLTVFLCFCDEEPLMARLLVFESLSAGPLVLARRSAVIAQLIAAVDAGRGETKGGADLPILTAEGTVGGALSILQTLIGSSHGEALVKLTNPLMGMIVMPYLGTAVARRELDRPVEPFFSADPVGERPQVDPFKHAGMRLTYRTIRVLMAVAEHPHASNRRVGELAEISDQGQTSKLLGRLKRIGLIDNGHTAPGQGAPNAWVLTNTGTQMTNSIRAHTNNPQ